MRHSKILLLAGGALATIAFAAQDSITLQRTLIENSTETYKIDSKVNETVVSPLGELPLNIASSMTYTLKTGKIDAAKGTAEVEVTTTVDKMDSDGPMGQLMNQQQVKPIVQKGTMDKRGHMVLALASPGSVLQLAASGVENSQSTLFIEFPGHPVKVGDTWDLVIPKSAFTGSEDQKLTAKLVGDKKVEGRDVWVVGVSGMFKVDFDSSKLPPTADEANNPFASTRLVSKGTVELTGEGYVDKATGKTSSMTSKGDMKGSVDMPDKGVTMDYSGTVSSVVKLQG